jgi:hypothetical protein
VSNDELSKRLNLIIKEHLMQMAIKRKLGLFGHTFRLKDSKQMKVLCLE